MKKLIAITGIILIGCVCIGAAFAPKDNPVQSTSASPESTEKTDSGYIIRAENGKIAVYRKNASEPLYTTDALVASLPRSDIDRLSSGIEVENERELRLVLQDYCS